MDSGGNAIRLNKFLAQCGVASRRGADELILSGAVSVNGAVVAEAGSRVDPARDVVAVHGRPVAAPVADAPLTLALHKPVQVVTTVRDPQGRRTVLDFLPPDIRAQRPFPVGRLDFLSEGLLLLTTDGELCNRLTHPRHHVHKTYRVRVRGQAPKAALDLMRGGMTLEEGERLAPVETRVLSESRGETLLEMTLIQGVNRQIRRMCRDLGLGVLQLTRVAQGPVRLGDLKPGAWRRLSAEEDTALRRAVGLAG
ncbi:rRNA pseudouridine synthase [Desulfovibrio aminophilus]|nr:pseudouridine synthase [Desulfovibrio aminophilus]MCM0754382.1 rRNA pseudouridine synthase [Desulfovibrio aminophilus]